MSLQEFSLKEKSLEEIKKLSLEEFSNLITSRERRSLRRGFSEDQKKLIKKLRKNPNKFHKTHCRDMIIIPEMIGMKIGVHNGKEFIALEISPQMLGHRLGEFAMTRKSVKHSSPGFGATKSSKFIPLK